MQQTAKSNRIAYHILSCIICLFLTKCLCQNEKYRWGSWSSYPLLCSVTCGTGIKCKVRNCLDERGNVQTFTDLCRDPEQPNSEAQLCTSCSIEARCPRLPGWSNWNPWSSCKPIEQKEIKDFSKCQAGYRIRFRACDSPPPDPPPLGLPCSGPNQAIVNCSYNCEDSDQVFTQTLSRKIQYQINQDFQAHLHMFNQVIRTKVKNFIQLSCETFAYDQAKTLISQNQLKRGRTNVKARGISTKWFKNGEPVKLHHAETGIKSLLSKRRKYGKSDDLLWEEQERWSNLYPVSHIYAEDKYLILPSVQLGDQGLYTCELAIKGKKWITRFYTLIVSGLTYLAELPDPFYLHSNLGYKNALFRVSIWLDGAQVVWKLNGVEQSRGLASRLDRRIQLIPHLNLTHQGIWTCYLVIPSPGTRNLPWAPRSGYFLINEFRLYVSSSPFGLWKLAQFPEATRMMRNLAAGFGLLSVALIALLLVNIWASYRWIVRTLSSRQKKVIIQEMVDNECRLLLVARKRARINKHKLLPLIIKGQQRLDRVGHFILDRLQQAYLVKKTIPKFPTKMNLTNLLFNAIIFDKELEDIGQMNTDEQDTYGDYKQSEFEQGAQNDQMHYGADESQNPENNLRGYNMNMQESSNKSRLLDQNLQNMDNWTEDFVLDKGNRNMGKPRDCNSTYFQQAEQLKRSKDRKLVRFMDLESEDATKGPVSLSDKCILTKPSRMQTVAIQIQPKTVSKSSEEQSCLGKVTLKRDPVSQTFIRVEQDDLHQPSHKKHHPLQLSTRRR